MAVGNWRTSRKTKLLIPGVNGVKMNNGGFDMSFVPDPKAQRAKHGKQPVKPKTRKSRTYRAKEGK